MLDQPRWKAALDDFVREVRGMYGQRLHRVVLYGSRARGDAREDSDIDVLVVLHSMQPFWDEMTRLDPVASRVSLEYDVVLSAIPVSATDLQASQNPLFAASRREGIAVG
jgi:uncharacterized protein